MNEEKKDEIESCKTGKNIINVNAGGDATSSIELSCNAKGQHSWKIKLYGNETTESLTKIDFVEDYLKKHYGNGGD